MLNNIRGILARRNEQARSPSRSESLISKTSDDGIENHSNAVEGFLCPLCKTAYPTADTLQNHYESNHPEEINDISGEGMSCPVCKMKLGSDVEFRSHYSRHHSNSKDEFEIEAMNMQIKALEEGKALLLQELQAVRLQSSELVKENIKIREERDKIEQKAAKLTSDLANLKVSLDEINSQKLALESSINTYKDKIKNLEVEIQQRPEADDVNVLKQEIVTVQKMMDQCTLQREAEKETLQKQCDALQETCLKSIAEKVELENLLKFAPKKEEIQSLQDKVTSLSSTISQLQKDVDLKEKEKNKLKISLEKYANYEEIKSKLADNENNLQSKLNALKEKDEIISKLKKDLKNERSLIEEMKAGREKLFSKIEEGEGANTAILQLKEENARLQEQFLHQQTLYGQTAHENEIKMDDLRSSLKKSNLQIHLLDEKNKELRSELDQTCKELEELRQKNNSSIEELQLQVDKLTISEESYKKQLNYYKHDLESGEKLSDELQNRIRELEKELNNQNLLYINETEKFLMDKAELENKLEDMQKTLAVVQADLLERENQLVEMENKLQQSVEKYNNEKENSFKLSNEIQILYQNCEDLKLKIKNMENVMSDSEATKSEFCDKISALNEELLTSRSKEAELSIALENMTEAKSQINEKFLSLDEEATNLRLSLSHLEKEKSIISHQLEDLRKEFSLKVKEHEEQGKKINELQEHYHKEKVKAEKISEDFKDAKELFLKEKLNLQKQIENLEDDCAKQISQVRETVKHLEAQLDEAEEKNSSLHLTLEQTLQDYKKKEQEWERTSSHHIAQIGVLTENVQTLREDLQSEQNKRENFEQKLDEISGMKLELEAKLENALEERRSLLERCLRSETECERLQNSNEELCRKYEDCVAALQELGRENQTLQVENMKHITRKWADDSEVTHCTACGKLFTVTIRKHHCRNCGNIFCNECSAKTATVASSKKPVRVCGVCYASIMK